MKFKQGLFRGKKKIPKVAFIDVTEKWKGEGRGNLTSISQLFINWDIFLLPDEEM